VTPELIIELGLYIEALLLSPEFNQLVNSYEQLQIGSLLATRLEDKDSRERIYAQLTGVREFLNFAAEIRKQAEELTKPEPDPIDLAMDDPRVHNLFD
jgi:hypothetical protein